MIKYLVRLDDTLQTVADKFGTTPLSIALLNIKQCCRELQLGDELQISSCNLTKIADFKYTIHVGYLEIGEVYQRAIAQDTWIVSINGRLSNIHIQDDLQYGVDNVISAALREEGCL